MTEETARESPHNEVARECTRIDANKGLTSDKGGQLGDLGGLARENPYCISREDTKHAKTLNLAIAARL